MTQNIKNIPMFNKDLHATLGMSAVKQLTDEQKKKIKLQLQNMYIGLVLANWANKENTKLGTAKQKALEQLESFAKTMEKGKNTNAVAHEISQHVAKIKKFVSKQIMTSETSEWVVNKEKMPKYKTLGENMISNNMPALRQAFDEEQEKIKTNDNKVKTQASPNQKIILQMLMQQQLQKAA